MVSSVVDIFLLTLNYLSMKKKFIEISKPFFIVVGNAYFKVWLSKILMS